MYFLYISTFETAFLWALAHVRDLFISIGNSVSDFDTLPDYEDPIYDKKK